MLVNASGHACLQLERQDNTIASPLNLNLVKPICAQTWLAGRQIRTRNLHVKSIATAKRFVVTQRQVRTIVTLAPCGVSLAWIEVIRFGFPICANVDENPNQTTTTKSALTAKY